MFRQCYPIPIRPKDRTYGFLLRSRRAPATEDGTLGYIGPANEKETEYGGGYLARTASHEQLEGGDQPSSLRIVIESPTREAAAGFTNEPRDAPHLQARTAGSNSPHFRIEGKDDLA
ncbi:DUF1330 domain-containing protein [Ruegeria sp. 2012CJ41-6]|uniref:DUF1330 domain-containing protein n=1 Tax=Ruegeria spongiae TaxID=2942209 RepID=A0ABT0Q461_9RHOB|nr:DUF1330 domain-containing protein [Ruegeria spongiae]MCL6284631.1 DUF1330 domain-containing protein [Ruegeria spongiae]